MPMPSDRKAAYTGLIIGVIGLVIVIVAISKLTSASEGKGGGEKSTASALR